jgi:hypothetical protein
MLALVVGAFLFAFELRLLFVGRTTFSLYPALCVAAVIGCGLTYVVSKKGPPR